MPSLKGFDFFIGQLCLWCAATRIPFCAPLALRFDARCQSINVFIASATHYFGSNMFNNHGRGPKPSKWTSTASSGFEHHFKARRGSPLDPAADSVAEQDYFTDITGAGEKWLYAGIGGEEPTAVRAALGTTVENIVLSISGALLALGCGASAGQGSCAHYWALADDTEVPEGTALATTKRSEPAAAPAPAAAKKSKRAAAPRAAGGRAGRKKK